MSYTASVITVSDKCSTGERVDTSGPAVAEMLREAGFEDVYTSIVHEESDMISAEIRKCE